MAGPGGISDADWGKAKFIGAKYNVDPLLLVAIGFHETNWGKAGLGTKGLILGVGAYDSGPVYTWAGLEKQLDQGAKILSEHDVRSIDDVKAGKAAFWTATAGWKEGVTAQYDRLKKDSSKKGIQIPGINVTIPGTGALSGVFDLPSSISSSTNAALSQIRKMGITFMVVTGGGILVILGLILLFREPIARAGKVAAELAEAK